MADGTSLMSDHHALVCVVDWPAAPQQPLKSGFVPIFTACVKWNPDKREQYVRALSANQQKQLRVSIIGAMQGGQLSVTEAFSQWSAAVCDVASGVFGVTVKRTGRMQDGRKANAWFCKCRPEWQALRQAVFHWNTHAAAAARRSFNAAKRCVKRAIDRQVHKRLLHDLRHNPRKLWTAYKGRIAPSVLEEPAGFDAHWRKLYGSSGQHSLPVCYICE
jgi:hypothetical protein